MDNKQLIEAGMEIMNSLDMAIQKASGAVSAFNIRKLKEMSAFDLISMLSTNNIRFVYKEEN